MNSRYGGRRRPRGGRARSASSKASMSGVASGRERDRSVGMPPSDRRDRADAAPLIPVVVAALGVRRGLAARRLLGDRRRRRRPAERPSPRPRRAPAAASRRPDRRRCEPRRGGGLDVAARGRQRRRRQRPPVRRRAGRPDPDRPRRDARRASRSSTSRAGSRAAASGACSASRSTRDFPTDPRFFVDYTDTNGDTHVSSFTVDAGEPATGPTRRRSADPASSSSRSRTTTAARSRSGRTAMLYIALGDGGSGGDPQGNGQSLDTLLGKILRIDVDGTTGADALRDPGRQPVRRRPSGAQPEIWLYGLRNPWRFSFDRRDRRPLDRRRRPGRLGGDRRRPGRDVRRQNFGWNRMEGAHCFRPQTAATRRGLTLPVAEYGHDHGCTVIGGYVYRGSAPAGRSRAVPLRRLLLAAGSGRSIRPSDDVPRADGRRPRRTASSARSARTRRASCTSPTCRAAGSSRVVARRAAERERGAARRLGVARLRRRLAGGRARRQRPQVQRQDGDEVGDVGDERQHSGLAE